MHCHLPQHTGGKAVSVLPCGTLLLTAGQPRGRASRAMDVVAIIATIALVLGPLGAYWRQRRVRAAAATAIAEMPLQPVVAHYSRLAVMSILLQVLVWGSGVLIFSFDKRVASEIQALRYYGVVPLGLVFLVWIYRFLFRAGDDVITVDETGLRDCRLSPDVIAWGAIDDVVEQRNPRGFELIGFVLKLGDAQAANLRLPSRSWIDRKLTGESGYRLLRVGFGGLDIAPRTMLDA